MEKNNIIMSEGLLGGLFASEGVVENLPALEELGGPLCFKLTGEKCSFVLGSLSLVDFVVDAKGVAKEHVSFVVDINGVRIIPILQHKTLLDDKLVTEAQILSHGAIISIAEKKFIFKEQADEQVAQVLAQRAESLLSEVKPKPATNAKKRGPNSIRVYDALFAAFVVSALVGTVFIYQRF